ncbi:hypothetical protein T05_14948 [Trichinella murrelli]|uniref:Uncharacterized protein n=1 Tax=Trichinella murrelli TaxID=144512 RepID=A0A0V0SWB5_9BILA|nr:hypothetical protein T05_14948 [Trichinella murrelli]
MHFRYKCYYDHEHCLGDIRLFIAISRQIRFHETCD